MKKLIPRTKTFAATQIRNVTFLLYMQTNVICSKNSSHVRTIKSQMIEVTYRSDMSRSLWVLLKDLTEQIVNHDNNCNIVRNLILDVEVACI